MSETHRVVGDLPAGAKEVPAVRREMIAAARENAGQWVLYTPGDAERCKDLSKALTMAAERCQAGFDGLGYEIATRGGQVYVRYNPAHPDIQQRDLRVVPGQRRA